MEYRRRTLRTQEFQSNTDCSGFWESTVKSTLSFFPLVLTGVSTSVLTLVKAAVNRRISHNGAQTHHSGGLTHAAHLGMLASSKLANLGGGT